MGKRKRSQKVSNTSIAKSAPQKLYAGGCYEGEKLSGLLEKLGKEIELAKISKGDMLPDKIWFKQQFSIGVNDVTRVLERMPSREAEQGADEPPSVHAGPKLPLVKLQAVLLASDCNPKWLTKHLPGFASSKGVPVISVRDNKGGSLRLGELVKLKTALAIGVKARGSEINRTLDQILHCRET